MKLDEKGCLFFRNLGCPLEGLGHQTSSKAASSLGTGGISGIVARFQFRVISKGFRMDNDYRTKCDTLAFSNFCHPEATK